MKKRIKSVLITFMLLATLLLVTACVDNSTPYDKNDASGYSVSVKYDANGGTFTTGTSVIVDSYNITGMSTNGSGKVELALLSPDNEARNNDKFTAVKNGYFLAGWYTERTESTDSEGNAVYTYANKWDFEKSLLEVDPNGTYTASEPVVTLYAAWVPMFEIHFYSVNDGSKIGTYSFNPTITEEIKVPEWNESTGAMEMYNFPLNLGYTFEAAYYDEAAKELVEGSVIHPGTVNEANGTAENASMNLYVNWMEGEWYHIYSLEQFKNNAKINGSYVLHTDLNFDGQYWPTSLMYGTFTGTILGNGHTISNVNFEQTNNGKNCAGLFGTLGESSKLVDLTFENVTFTIKSGTRIAGTSYGLLAGIISENATLGNVKILNSTLQVDNKAYFGTEDYVVGKICGSGDFGTVDYSGITCKVVGDGEKYELIENGNEIEIKTK